MIIKIKKYCFITGLIFIFVMLWSGSPYQTIFPIVTNLQVPIACVLTAFILLKNSKRFSASFYSVSILVFMLMIFLTWSSHFFEVPVVYLKKACFILLAFAVAQLYNFCDVVRVYLKTMTVVSIVSLVAYILVNSTSILHNLPSFANGNGVEYNIGVVFNFITEFPERNCGIFWEPGIYASFLALAIVLELCFNNQPRNAPRLILFFVTLLTTNSAAGIVLWLLCFMLLIGPRIWKRKNIFSDALGYVLLLFLIFVFTNSDLIITWSLQYFDNPYLRKLLSENVMTNFRYLGLLHNLQVFAEYPIFGAGLSTAATRLDYVADISTSTYLMSIYGILGMFYSICWIVGVCRQKHLNNFNRILIISILFLIVNKETHTRILFSWIFMFLLLKPENFVEEKSEDPSTNFVGEK